MKLKLSLVIVLVSFLFGCSSVEDKTDVLTNQDTNKKGQELMESKCYACHNPSASMDARLAPPMIAVKKHYLEKFTSKDEFVSKIVDFASNPKEDKALLKGAVAKFKLMPNMNFEKADIKLIAEYIYDSKIAEPDWFANHMDNDPDEKLEGNAMYIKKGMDMALKTKKVLGKNLMGQINKNGTSQALTFCSEKAYPIIDSMSTELGAKIKRVTDLPRNPKNEASGDELKYILAMKNNIVKGEKPKPAMKEENGKMIGFYPIMTNQMCLQCHGSEKEIKPDTWSKIKSIFPNDKAVGYSANQLRGIWVVEMEK